MFYTDNPTAAPLYSWGLRGLGSPRQPTGGFGKSVVFLARTHGVADMDETRRPLGRKASFDPVTYLAASPILSEKGYWGPEKRDSEKEIPLIFLVKKEHQ